MSLGMLGHVKVRRSKYFCKVLHSTTTSSVTCRLGTMETAPCAIGQTAAPLEPNYPNPPLQQNCKVTFMLKCQFQAYQKKTQYLPT